jgi:hypothetical protein
VAFLNGKATISLVVLEAPEAKILQGMLLVGMPREMAKHIGLADESEFSPELRAASWSKIADSAVADTADPSLRSG